MKNIFVPTDFSQTAENAFLFAQEMFAGADAKLTTIHYFLPALPGDGTYPPLEDYLEQWQKTSEERMAEFVRKNALTFGAGDVMTQTEIEQIIQPGFAGEQIVQLSGTSDVDLIVIGATGEKGWAEKLFGSVSVQVAQNAWCPVLLVPDKARFTGFKNVLYATNHDETDEEMLHYVEQLTGLFEARIHLVHVEEDIFSDYSEHAFKASHLFKKQFPGLSFQVVRIEADDVADALETYVSKHDIDLVVMATRHRNFIGKLLHKSRTKAMAFNARTPLLVLHSGD